MYLAHGVSRDHPRRLRLLPVPIRLYAAVIIAVWLVSSASWSPYPWMFTNAAPPSPPQTPPFQPASPTRFTGVARLKSNIVDGRSDDASVASGPATGRLQKRALLNEEAARCPSDCVKEESGSFKKFQSSVTLNTIFNSSHRSTRTAMRKLDDMCSLYKDRQECLNRCDRNAHLMLVELGLIVPKVLCGKDYMNFRQSVPCWFKNMAKVEKKCNHHKDSLTKPSYDGQGSDGSGGRGSSQSTSNAHFSPFLLLASPDPGGVLPSVCTTILHLEACQRNALEYHCGASVSFILWQLQSHSHQIMAQLLDQLQRSEQEIIPKACRIMLSVNRRYLDRIYNTSGASSPMLTLFWGSSGLMKGQILIVQLWSLSVNHFLLRDGGIFYHHHSGRFLLSSPFLCFVLWVLLLLIS